MITYVGIRGRSDIPRFLNEHGLVGVGVEVGTHRGVYAEHLLKTWRGSLLCVDPWSDAPGGYDQVPILPGDTRNDHEAEAINRLGKFISQGRCTILRYTSDDATLLVSDNSLDFVYLDGNHMMQYVLNDLRNWFPKLKSGGYMFGHDVVCPGELNGGWGSEIQPALSVFTSEHSLDFSLIPDGSSPWSFAIRKP
jgi:hypothetical protein